MREIVRDAVRGIVRRRAQDIAQTTVTLLLLGALLGCSKPPETPTVEMRQPTGLESIPGTGSLEISAV